METVESLREENALLHLSLETSLKQAQEQTTYADSLKKQVDSLKVEVGIYRRLVEIALVRSTDTHG